jgi:hypothetical protein
MPRYRSGTNDWASLTVSFADSGPWYDPLEDASGNVSIVGTTRDLGTNKWVWPETVVQASGIGNAGITISYQSSTDNVSFTTHSVGSFEGRYVRTVIEADADVVYSASTVYNDTIKTRVYENLDSENLGGNINQRTIDLSDDFSEIFGIVLNSAGNETDLLIIDIANTAPANVAFTIRDVDTYGKVPVNGNVNITITGYPALALDTTAGTVTRSDQ